MHRFDRLRISWKSWCPCGCWRCIAFILEFAVDNASSEVASWWRRRVASLADLTAHEARREAIVESWDGLVLDWLLKEVGGSRAACQFTQAKASRALAYLLSDVNTSDSVLGRPHAPSYQLHFAASIHVNDAVEEKQTLQTWQQFCRWWKLDGS